MKKLFVKELLEIYWYLLLGMLIIGSLILLGDTLTFMRRSFSLKYIVVAIPCCTGLAMYARENHTGSLDFMLSRPIKWWWVYLTKLLVGILFCTILTAFAALLYFTIMPADYRPFMPITDLFNRAMVLWVALLISFICGFAVSSVSSGFAVAISILFGLFIARSVLFYNVYREVDFAYLLCLPAILIVASIICARLPLAVSSSKRMKVWFIIVVIGFSGYIAANVLFGSNKLEMYTYNSVTSPDGKWIAYLDGKNKVPSNSRVALWMSSNDGHKYEIERCVSPTFLMWLYDGDSMLYIANKSTKAKNGPACLMIAKRSNQWRAEVIAKLPPPDAELEYYGGFDWTYSVPPKLSPSAAKLAFEYASGSMQLDTYSNLIVVVDMNTHKTYSNKLDICIDFWWVDENRIAVQTDKKIIVIPATGKKR